jgi:hypothetical protein
MSEVSKMEELAMHGKPCPSTASVLEITEHLYFSMLYGAYRKGMIDRNDATEEKKKFNSALSALQKKMEFGFLCWNRAAERYRTTELAFSEYRKNRTIENADKAVAAWDRCSDG